MKTFIQLDNKPELDLPEEFQDDDVRLSENLIEYVLNEYTKLGNVVFDPFVGFGSTLRVAERLGRIGYGIEYDEKRYNYAKSLLQHPGNLIHGDALKLNTYNLPSFDFCFVSPPYMNKDDRENPFTSYTTEGKGYTQYLQDMQYVFEQMKTKLNDNAFAVIEVSNLKRNGEVTTLAWDIARAVSNVLHFEGEIVIGWDRYGYGYTHSYCLVFRNKK